MEADDWLQPPGEKNIQKCILRLYLLIRREGDSSFCSARYEFDSGLKEVEKLYKNK